jgi:hypothetical protein
MLGNQKGRVASLYFIKDAVPVGDETLPFTWRHEAN